MYPSVEARLSSKARSPHAADLVTGSLRLRMREASATSMHQRHRMPKVSTDRDARVGNVDSSECSRLIFRTSPCAPGPIPGFVLPFEGTRPVDFYRRVFQGISGRFH